MPENAEKFPKPRIGGTSMPGLGRQLAQRLGPHRALEVDVEVGFREVPEIAHEPIMASAVRPVGGLGRHRNAAFIRSTYSAETAAPSMVPSTNR